MLYLFSEFYVAQMKFAEVQILLVLLGDGVEEVEEEFIRIGGVKKLLASLKLLLLLV